ncbi:MAG TPA: hypothetical protein VFN85_01415, partial [Solirubrobacterales bacterium]|nr:hypothetical protein [Solirubrobacterales bacterium]
MSATEEDGSVDLVAGSHPYELRTRISLDPSDHGDLRELHVAMPPGLIENPSSVEKCSAVQFSTPRTSPFQESLSGEDCPNRSQIGTITVTASYGGGVTRTFGLFNLVPSPGVPSAFGASPFRVPVVFSPHIREESGTYGLTVDLEDLSQLYSFESFELTLWGSPWAAPEPGYLPWNAVPNGAPTWTFPHDDQRGDCLNEIDPEAPFGSPSFFEPTENGPIYREGTCGAGNPYIYLPHPYLTLPSSCDAPLAFTATATSWQGATSQATAESRDGGGQPAPLEGCQTLQFEPNAVARLTTGRTTSSTGFDFTLDGNASGLLNPALRAGSQVAEAQLDLADGITINPSLGAGLGTCPLSTFEAIRNNGGAECPNDSKIGELTVESPLFEGQMQGGVFLATPDDPAAPGRENPFDSLIALYLVARSPERGLAVKVPGKLEPDLATGNLHATFTDLPELPYSHFNVHFRDGQRSPLASPPACGTYSSRIDLVPHNDPSHHEVRDSRFELSTGIGGGPCPSGLQPFAPSAKGGMANRNAGSYTPFYLRLTRTDADQEITSYSIKLPPGLLGKIAGIPYCSEADIAHAAHNSGFAEAAHPSCPEASKIGHTVSGYGLGSTLTYAPGGLYLAGPYHGLPFSVVAIDSATVGPFDLGVVIVRSAIRVNPRTSQVSIDSAGSDPIPHIIGGIPIHLRDIRVYMDRPGFMINPTNCSPFSLDSVLTGAGADLGTSADDPTATASAPFQVSNCSALGFKPSLTFRLKGKAKRGDYPALTAVYTPRPGDANVSKVTATLSPKIFLAQGHIDTVCTRKQFAAGQCPKSSIYGYATAESPLLGEPLSGPVYLRSSENTLPDMVASISGNGLSFEVVGRVSSYKGS